MVTKVKDRPYFFFFPQLWLFIYQTLQIVFEYIALTKNLYTDGDIFDFVMYYIYGQSFSIRIGNKV